MIDRVRRRLSRLRVSQRLALLVLVPLIAVVGLAVPVVVERANLARGTAAIADEAQTRRAVGRLLEELQRERLLSLLYIALPGSDSLPVVRQSQAVNDALDDVRRNADPRLGPGVARLTELLGVVRPRVLNRSVAGLVTHTLFSQGVAAVLETMPPPTATGSTASVPPVGVLDELLRANEQAARVGAAVLVAATEPQPGQLLLADAMTALGVHTVRFTALARGDQRQLLTGAENSQAARRVDDEIAAVAASASRGDLNVAVGRIASAVETYTTLRRLVGDRIAREIVDTSASAASRARTTALVVGLLALLLLLIVGALAAAGARSIAQPLAQLNAAAVAVAAATGRELERVSDDESTVEAAPSLQAVPTTGPGDVADLAAAFNQVQKGAAALLARQLTTRRNVSAMFATVARRTRNLADRQLNLIDVLEHEQQDPQLLDRLYRLDHVATRLRRSASALLVVSGATDDTPASPMRLVDVVRAAAAEIEEYTRVQLIDAVEVAAAPSVVPDLILLVAELLDNAVRYAAPPSPVNVMISLSGSGCRMSIQDTGIGMAADQLIAENRRLVERERLDIAPTRVLGLFVVGRLARRHGMQVTLAPNQPEGLVVHIDLPGRLLTAAVGPTAPAPAPRGMRQAARASAPNGSALDRRFSTIEVDTKDGRFEWFGPGSLAPEIEAAPAAARLPAGPAAQVSEPPPSWMPPPAPMAPPPAPPPPARPARESRPPQTVPPQAVPPQAVPPQAVPPQRVPSGVGSADGWPADADPQLQPLTRSGLSRRIPGRNLPPGTRPADPGTETTIPLDPAAARASVEAFAGGFERGSAAPADFDAPPDSFLPDPRRQVGPTPWAAPPGVPVGPPSVVRFRPPGAGRTTQPGGRDGAQGTPGTPTQPPPHWPIASPRVGNDRGPRRRTGAQPGAVEGEVVRSLPHGLPPAQQPAAPPGLTRRIPGANLADELRMPSSRTAGAAPVPGHPRPGAAPGEEMPNRDPAVEQQTLDMLLAGFAAGAAAPPEQAGDGATVRFNQGAPSGPAQQNVERR